MQFKFALRTHANIPGWPGVSGLIFSRGEDMDSGPFYTILGVNKFGRTITVGCWEHELVKANPAVLRNAKKPTKKRGAKKRSSKKKRKR